MKFKAAHYQDPVAQDEQEKEKEDFIKALKLAQKRRKDAVEDFLKRPEVKRSEKNYKIVTEFQRESKDLQSWTKFIDKPE